MSSHTSCIAREYSEKSDMWSLGMVLYAMCFTSLPFSHDDPHAPWVRKSWVHMSNVGETFYCRAPTGNGWNPIYEFIYLRFSRTNHRLHELNTFSLRAVFFMFFILCRLQPPQKGSNVRCWRVWSSPSWKKNAPLVWRPPRRLKRWQWW